MKNKNLKKWLSAALACTMAAGLLAGCGGGSDEATTNEDGEVVIEFGIHVANPQEQEAVTYNIVQAFNEKYDGQYQVDFRAADTETHSKNMQLAAADGTLPEIFWIEASEAPEYSESGLLLDVSDFLSENPEIQERSAEWRTRLQMTMVYMAFRIRVMYRDSSTTRRSLMRRESLIRQPTQHGTNSWRWSTA